MFKLIHVIIIACFLILFSCSKHKEVIELTDDEFYKSLYNENHILALNRIDSLLEYGDNTNHRRGLLFHEKGRVVQILEKENEAIINFKKGLFLLNKKNKRIIGLNYRLQGVSYAFLSERDTAIYYTKKASNLYKEINYREGEAECLGTLAYLAFLKDDYSKSVSYLEEAINIQIDLDDKNELARSYNNLSNIFEATNEYDEAIKHYQKAATINIEINNLDSYPLKNLGRVYCLKKEFEKSKEAYKAALIIEEKTENHTIQKEIYEGLIETCKEDKDPFYLLSVINKKDSISKIITSLDNKEKIRQLTVKNEEFIAEENLKQELKLNEKNRIVLGSILAFFVVFGLYMYQKSKNYLLYKKQQTIELEQKMLRIQMNPHFIFNTLTAIQNKIFDDEPLQQMTYISKFAKLIRQNFDFVSKKEISLSEDLDALKNYIETQQFRFNNKFSYTIIIDDKVDPDDISIPPMLLQIFVENAIEHGLKPKNEQGHLTIRIDAKKEFIQFKIIDDGIGYTQKEREEEHALDIFKKRLILRKLGEEKMFSIKSLGTNLGTEVTFSLSLI